MVINNYCQENESASKYNGCTLKESVGFVALTRYKAFDL